MAGQLIPRGKSKWLIRVFVGRDPQTGKREYYNETFHGSKKEAEAALLEALQDRRHNVITSGTARRTVGALLDDLLLDYKINGKDHDWAERVVRVHLRPKFGSIRVTKLGTTQIRQYVDERQQEGGANATINRALALLKRAFNLGRKSTPTKVAIVPHIPMLQEKNVRKGFFEHDDYLRLRNALPAEVRPILTFGYYTGCRKGEILALEWRQIDLAERMVQLDPGTTKNDEPRKIPVDGELYETLVMQRSIRDSRFPESPWVFSRSGDKILDFRGAWDEACKAVGLWDTATKKPTKLFHDLRRSGVRNLVRAGVPEKTAMAISGHKTRSVFDRYNIVDESDLRSAARRVTDYIAAKTAAAEDRHTIGTQAQKQADTADLESAPKLLN